MEMTSIIGSTGGTLGLTGVAAGSPNHTKRSDKILFYAL